MKITTKDIFELRKQLDFINIGMFVSILPDEMIDLNPSDTEILEAVGYLVDELYFSLYRDVRRPEYKPTAPDERVVRNINDMCFNIIAHAMYRLWRAIDPIGQSSDTHRATHACNVCTELERFLTAICPDPEDS